MARRGAQALATALETNTSLTSLDIAGNYGVAENLMRAIGATMISRREAAEA